MAVRSSVSLKIYNSLGQNVATLVNGENSAGEYRVLFDARNLTSDIYFYRLQVRQISRGHSSAFTETKKLVLLK